MKQGKKIIYGLTALCAVLVVVVVALLFKVLTPQTPPELGGGQEPVVQASGEGGEGRNPVASASGEGGQDNAVQTPTASQTQDVGQEAAKSAALTHAGLAESQVIGMKVEQDWDDGRLEYEIEFWSEGTEYDYTIDGITGSVLGCKQEIRVDQESQDVGQEAAKSAALTHAGLAESQVTGMKVEQDWDDGRLEYEIEFKFDGMEYDYTIDGSTGTIISCEKEIDD